MRLIALGIGAALLIGVALLVIWFIRSHFGTATQAIQNLGEMPIADEQIDSIREDNQQDVPDAADNLYTIDDADGSITIGLDEEQAQSQSVLDQEDNTVQLVPIDGATEDDEFADVQSSNVDLIGELPQD